MHKLERIYLARSIRKGIRKKTEKGGVSFMNIRTIYFYLNTCNWNIPGKERKKNTTHK